MRQSIPGTIIIDSRIYHFWRPLKDRDGNDCAWKSVVELWFIVPWVLMSSIYRCFTIWNSSCYIFTNSWWIKIGPKISSWWTLGTCQQLLLEIPWHLNVSSLSKSLILGFYKSIHVFTVWSRTRLSSVYRINPPSPAVNTRASLLWDVMICGSQRIIGSWILRAPMKGLWWHLHVGSPIQSLPKWAPAKTFPFHSSNWGLRNFITDKSLFPLESRFGDEERRLMHLVPAPAVVQLKPKDCHVFTIFYDHILIL